MSTLAALALMLSLALAPLAPAAALSLSSRERAAVRDVVKAQLDALRRDDGATAFGYASPSMRALFHTPERFMSMVRHGYAAVCRPLRVEFREVVRRRGRIVQRVRLVGPEGERVLAHYLMERQPDGSWRIDGCILESAADISA